MTATYYQQVAEHRQAAQHNVEVMNGYTGASRYNTDGQPTTFGSWPTTDADDLRESTRDDGSLGVAPWPGDPGYRSPADGDHGTQQERSVGTTTPGSHLVTQPSAGSVLPSPGTDAGVGQARPVPGGGMVTGVGLGFPVVGRGADGGGQRAGTPRGGNNGAGVGAGQPGATGRALGGAAAATGPGRGGVGFGGVPVGAGGRGRGEEDLERKAPAYLEGGDPEELFDTDLLTAPPAIGDEDEDD